MRRTSFFGPLPLTEWPAADLTAWAGAGAGDPLSEGGAGLAAHWRQTTRGLVQISYGVWLAWLRATRRLDATARPGERAKTETVRAFLEDMRFSGLSEATCATRLIGLGTALRVISPNTSSSFIVRAGGRIIARSRRGKILGQAGQSVEELLGLGRQLIEQATIANQPWAIDQALAYRDGLLLSLLVHRPLRLRNLTSIEIGRHLVRGRKGWRLEFEAGEMKGNLEYSCQFPESLVPWLEQYIDEVRPLLAQGRKPCSSLWLSIHGKALSAVGVGGIVGRRTMQAFGRRHGPHLVRHIVATTIAERMPDRSEELTLRMLGHLDIGMSERHYNHSLGRSAAPILKNALDARLGRLNTRQ